MYARVTLFELDTIRTSPEQALETFKERVLPELRGQPGYEGLYVLTTPEGKGLLLSLWQTEAAAQAGVTGGFYDAQIAKVMMLLREPPGRDHYQVLFAEAPAAAPA
jgi:heme-degrading monooxygenase HmoA